ncbi:heme transporter hrg1-A isoform X2 [Aplysia californica]|uniref:Heme transporter hrg1-A isoform X2 n=1 Tax=Aplysia californica TaxID=6500 RepID=A0ABM0JJS4_APLCA|nr:heme transporter hrg1-A isoform X2 [Aplysia californica]
MEDYIEVRQISSCAIKSRIVFSTIGVFVGLSICAVFGAHYHNYNVALWGLTSGIAAAVALGVTIAYIKHMWDSNPRRLKGFMLAGCFIQLAGVCGFVTYLVLAITNNQDLIVYGPGYYLTCVWCFMTWKWGFWLLIYSRSFLRSYGDADRMIQGEDVVAPGAL